MRNLSLRYFSVQLALRFSQRICKYTRLEKMYIEIIVEEMHLFVKGWGFDYK